MKTFYPLLKKSCKTFFSNFRQSVIIMLLDIAFFVVMALVYTKIWEKTLAHVQAIVDLMGAEIGDLAGVQTEAQLSALAANQAQFMVHYNQIGKYVLMLAISLFIFWSVFHGLNWFITQNLIGKKMDFRKYMQRFAVISFVGWLAFMILAFFSLKMAFYASQSLFPEVGGIAKTVVNILLLFILFYLSYTAYAMIPRHSTKEIFRNLIPTALNKYRTLLPVYAFMSLVILGEYLVFVKMFYFGGYAAGAFAVIIMFPTIAWTRFYAINALE
ncbi:hypothetical protein JW707_01010 [Candidatus Woesearchaeota archaeon]|nr:hypothetical protein [Candidatus Woesearchaeota archaeon]